MIAAQEFSKFSIENKKEKRDKMVLISVHIPPALLEILDNLVKQGVYPNRSEAIRDAIRLLLLHFRDSHEAEPQ